MPARSGASTLRVSTLSSSVGSKPRGKPPYGPLCTPRGAATEGDARPQPRKREASPGDLCVRSILAVQADQLALNLDPVRRQDANLVGRVGRLERDRGAAPAEAFQGCFLVVDQRHDDVARVGTLVALD